MPRAIRRRREASSTPTLVGSNTAADHLAVLDAGIAALPRGFRRRLMVTCDGAGPATT